MDSMEPMPRALGWSCLAAVVIAACASEARPPVTPSRPPMSAPAGPAPEPPVSRELSRHVVLVSIDGMRADYYTQADRYGLAIPTLRGLMKRGRYAEGVTGTWPTVTYPAHTTLVTGARPNRHGILSNRPFDPTYQNQGGWNWYAESIKADTLWAAARRAGKTTGSVYWPVTVGAAIDDDFPQFWRAKVDEDDKLLRALTTPGLAEAYAREYGALPAEHRTDAERANAAEFLLRERRHDLTLVYFTDLDEAEHAFGPGSKEALATLEHIDAQLARVLAGIDAAGDRARTAVVVVSDHGFAAVRKVTHPAVLLREAGLIDVSALGAVVRWRAGVVAVGGMAAIFLKDPSNLEDTAKVTKLFDDAARDSKLGIRAVHRQDVSEHEGGFGGAAVVLEAEAGYEFDASFSGAVVGPSTDKGAHGYPPENPDMRASLILEGSGIRPGAPVGIVPMTAIAPTVAALLGVTLKDAESPPLRDVLVSP
jgi:predicted AlkP superfamily pyrophosphatase or phosphodiesterase